ncbi:NAD(P)-dependent oxidoreductase [Aliiglaciecola sp.]|nr:NAD(P)-dependent oxidoreductase [Aliiglaciecola sp.]
MRRIIIIGASGFVGQALLAALSKSQFDVVGVSRTHKKGLAKVDSYDDCPAGDLLVHLAEESDIHQANLLGDSYLNKSHQITQRLCDKFKGNVIYCSSAAVYGDKNHQASKESDVVKGANIYSQLKLLNEQTVLERGGCVLRLSNLYGEGMSPNNVLSDILSQVGQVGPLRLRSTDPIRDFLYIDDLVRLISIIAERFQSGVYNVGAGEGISIRALAETVLSVYGEANREIESMNTGSQESVNFLDTSKVLEMFDWKPKHSLKDNLNILKQGSI